MAEAPNQSKRRRFQGPVPPGADEKTFRDTGKTTFTHTPISGPTNIPGSRGGGRGGRGRSTPSENLEANRQAEAIREANKRAQEEANSRKAQREAQNLKLRQDIISKKKQQEKKSLISGIVQGLKAPNRVRREVIRQGVKVVKKQAKKPLKIPLTFGITKTNIVASSDVAKKNLQEGRLTKIVGGGQNMKEFEQGVGLLFPGTQGEIVKAAVIGAGITALPPVGQSLVGFSVAADSAKQLDNKSIVGPQRKALFLTGAMGVLGGVLPINPFVKGKVAGATGGKTTKVQAIPKETSVKQPIGPKLFGPYREVITDVKSSLGKIDLGLIPEGRGFGFTRKEQTQLVGLKGTITTSARDLVGPRGGKVKVEPGPEGKGLFFSPTPPELGGGVRVSRLGLAENPFKFPKLNAELSFTSEKPQVVFGENIKIKNVGYKSSELETTIGPGAEFFVQRRGTGVVKGQKVELQEIVGFKQRGKTGGTVKGPGVTKLKSGSVTQKINPTSSLSPKIIKATPLGPRSRGRNRRNVPTIKTGPISKPTPPRGGGGSASPPPVIRSPPTTRIRIARARAPPTKSPPILRGGSPFSRKELFPTRGKGISKKKGPRFPFSVEVRRFGKFTPIGTTRTLSGAVKLGSQRVSKTLSATFRVRGPGKVKAPPGFRRPKALGGAPNTFVERRGLRLSRSTEVKQIQTAKKRKRKKKKR